MLMHFPEFPLDVALGRNFPIVIPLVRIYIGWHWIYCMMQYVQANKPKVNAFDMKSSCDESGGKVYRWLQ